MDKTGRPTLSVTAHYINITTLTDTGASCSLLRRDIYEKIVGKTHRVGHLEKTPRVQAVNGSEMPTIGQSQIQLDLIPDPVLVVFVDTLPHQMIIVNSILRNGCAVLDLHNQVLQWYGRKWKIQRHELAGFESIGPMPTEIGNARIDKLVRRNADIFSAKGETLGKCST